VTGGTKSRIWSIGSMPLMIMSALVETKDGITSPGQSQRISDLSRCNVYRKPTYTITPLWQCTAFKYTQIWSQK